MNTTKKIKVAIVGGGISGVMSCIKLSEERPNVEIDLFEKRSHLLGGPPYCHLHAGGFLYPEISLVDSHKLLNHSLDFAKMFREALIIRPTIISYNKNSLYDPQELIHKCHAISQLLAEKQCCDSILGNPNVFHALYNYKDALFFKENGHLPESTDPARKYHDPYVENFLNLLTDISSIKYPFASVNEPGINQDKVESKCLQLLESSFVNVHLNSEIKPQNIHYISSKQKWMINDCIYDFLINTAGYASHTIFPNISMLELKSAYLIQNTIDQSMMPEIAIIGKRNTENGLLQITPIGHNTFQIHSMTNDSSIITMVSSRLPHHPAKIDTRTRASKGLDRIIAFMPSFENTVILNKALFGIQRLPDNSLEKRLSHLVCDFSKNYIEIQLVKATSVVHITNQLQFQFKNKFTQ